MKLTFLSVIIFYGLNISVNACNLNLPQEKFMGKAKTPYKNLELDKSLGNTIAYHHIIPRVELENILYLTFNSLDFLQNPEAKQFFKQLANQITYPSLGVEFKDNRSRNITIELLTNLSNGSINNKLIDGKNEMCLSPEQQKTFHNYISYMPADGFFGPEPLQDDPGSNLDGYGKYFMNKNTYSALQKLYLNRGLKNKALNLASLNQIVNSYQISAFNINLWGKINPNKFACLVNNYYTQCLER